MNFLKKLASLFTPPASGRAESTYNLAVQCHRCGEVIHTQINLTNDLSADYDEDGSITTYVCRKILVGKERCFQQIEVRLMFNAQRELTDQQITGGKFVEGQPS